jgi:monoamine oxidase
MQHESQVAIVGAGVAGLSAAAALTCAGISVHIVEARERIGGRIYTVHEPGLGAAIELGAEFVHGKPPEIWDLLDGNGAGAVEGSGRNWCSQHGEIRQCDFFEQVQAFLGKMKVTPGDQPFREFLEAATGVELEVKRRALMYVEGFNAARAEEISVNSLVRAAKAEEEIEGDRAFHIRGGYDYIPRALLGRCDPRYLRMSMNTVAHEIDWNREAISVRGRCGGEEFAINARRAIVTLPLGVLQSGAVKFTPALTEKQNALTRLVMGPVIRIALQFREKFWDRPHGSGGESLADLRFLFTDDESFPTWWTPAPINAPLMIGWAPSRAAERLSGRPVEFIKQTAVDSLAHVLHTSVSEISRFLVDAYVHDWQSDPFSCGAYSYVRTGGDGAQRHLAAPLAGTLFFAGEACDEGHFGTVHGAIASGRRAAREVLDIVERLAA